MKDILLLAMSVTMLGSGSALADTVRIKFETGFNSPVEQQLDEEKTIHLPGKDRIEFTVASLPRVSAASGALGQAEPG